MRHRKHTIRFGRQRSHYKATLRHLVAGLIINKSIQTTRTKAKEASRFAEKLVTLAKDKTVANQRKAYAFLGHRDLVAILFNEIGPLFKDRKGGYTRVILNARRKGDNAQMAILEFVEKPAPEVKVPKKKEKKQEKEPVQPEVKPKPEVEEKKPAAKPRPPKAKEKVIRKKEEPKRAPEVPPLPKPEPEKPKKEETKPEKPGFFKRLFGRKK